MKNEWWDHLTRVRSSSSLFLFFFRLITAFGGGGFEVEADGGDDGNLRVHGEFAGLHVAVGVEAAIVGVARAAFALPCPLIMRRINFST